MSAPSCCRPHRNAGPGRGRQTEPPLRRRTGRRGASSHRDASLLTAAGAALALVLSGLLPLTSCSSPPPHWHAVTSSPNPGLYENELFRVAAVSSKDIWAVGEY